MDFFGKYDLVEKPGNEDSKMKTSAADPDYYAHRDSLPALALTNFRYIFYPADAIYTIYPANTQMIFNNSGITYIICTKLKIHLPGGGYFPDPLRQFFI